MPSYCRRLFKQKCLNSSGTFNQDFPLISEEDIAPETDLDFYVHILDIGRVLENPLSPLSHLREEHAFGDANELGAFLSGVIEDINAHGLGPYADSDFPDEEHESIGSHSEYGDEYDAEDEDENENSE